MTRLFIESSKYVLLLLMLLFLLQVLLFVVGENKRSTEKRKRVLRRMRGSITLFHLLSFAVLGFSPLNLRLLCFGAACLVFLYGGLFFLQRIYRKGDTLLWHALFFLLDISLIMLSRLNLPLAERQLVFMVIGFAAGTVMPLCLHFFSDLGRLKYLYLFLALAFIACTLVFGSEEYGSRNWIYLGGFGFQPSEIVKFLFIFYLASVFRKPFSLGECIITILSAAVIVLLLVYQRDLGAALIFFMSFLLLLYMATDSLFLFFGGLLGAGGAAAVAYRLFSHVRVRVAAWRDPWADVDAGGYQIAQSLFAICTGGFWGSGLGLGLPQTIPVVEKDFIFAAICEEFGVFFALCLILLFLIMFLRGMRIALRSENRFYSFVAAGIVTMLAFQTFLIIGGTIKLIPLTGVTLPFISYGGSSVVVSLVMFCLLQWIEKNCCPKEEDEEDDEEAEEGVV